MDALPKRDQALAKTATVLWDLLTRQRQAINEHVKSHNLDPWNTLADNLAKASAQGLIQDTLLPDVWVDGLREGPQKIWEWLRLA
eukprot:7653320-Pyramimonas_sp.AAC.1